LGEKRDFEEHAACEVYTFEEFEVDVHVEWKLSLTLKALLLRRDLIIALNHDTLSQQFLLAPATADLLEGVLCFVDESGTESAKADLNKSTIEEDLGVNVEVADCLLQVGHQHHIASLVVAVMQSKEVDLAKHCTRADDALAVDKQVIAKDVDESGGVCDLATRGDD
jgi:hypothetical protein